MTGLVVRKFNRAFRSSMQTETTRFIKKKENEHASRVLFNILKERMGLFPRMVIQSVERDGPIPPFGYSDSRYYYVARDIGVVNGRHLLFEDQKSYLCLYEEKKGTKTDPPTVENLNLEVTPRLARQVTEFLDSRKFPKRNSDQLRVPKGFYVFEFTALKNEYGSPGVRRVMTIMPFKAKNLNEAVNIMLMCPHFIYCYDFRDFRVYTSGGCQKLNSKIRNGSISQWDASLRDYEVSPTA